MLFKKPVKPFSSIEEAYDFIDREGFKNFLIIMDSYQNNVYFFSFKITSLYFLVYLGLYSLIFLFDYNTVNKAIYDFAIGIGVPIKDPYGWNLSFFLSLFFNIWAFISTIKYNCRWVNKIVRLQSIYLVNYVIALIIMILTAILTFYLSLYTLTVKSKECTLFSLCWLETDNMFYVSTLYIYTGHWITFIVIFACFFCSYKLEKVELR